MKKITNVPTKTNLAKLQCRDDEVRLKMSEVKAMEKKLGGKWKLKGAQQLEKSFKFPDFKTALKFANQVGAAAEKQGHHPDVFLTYGEVRLQLSSHEAKGLTMNDFILAAKINELK